MPKGATLGMDATATIVVGQRPSNQQTEKQINRQLKSSSIVAIQIS